MIIKKNNNADKKLTLRAKGKINLYLNVKKGYRDDGYHEIKSIMQSISLSDELNFKILKNDIADRKNPKNENGIYITSNNIDIPLDEKNLVHKAALLILDNFNLKDKYSVKINITKHIPVCSGLAGGSTNAAATIIALNMLFNLNLETKKLINFASRIGSDVPFCISGGTALVEGRGEIVSKLPPLPFYWVVLANNGKKFLSKDAYEKFDLAGIEKKPIHTDLVSIMSSSRLDNFFNSLVNDLEGVVAKEDEVIILLKQKALKEGAFFAQMTGSGPTVFALCKDLKSARKVYQELRPLSNEVFLSYTVPHSLNFI